MLGVLKNKRVLYYMLFVIIISFGILVSGCGPEPCSKNLQVGCKCEFNSDCPTKKYFTSKCVDSVCKQTPIPDVCGNGLEDEGENSCNCPKDVDENKCEGKKVLEVIRGKEITTDYLEYMCDEEDKCVLNYDESIVKEVPLTYELKNTYFRLEGRVYYNDPFDVDRDKLKVEFELKDFQETIVPPIKITGIKLKGGETLYGLVSETKSVSSIGNTVTFYVPLDYDLDKVEEEVKPTLVVDYEYSVTRGDEVNVNRNTHEKKFTNPMMLVEIGEELQTDSEE